MAFFRKKSFDYIGRKIFSRVGEINMEKEENNFVCHSWKICSNYLSKKWVHFNVSGSVLSRWSCHPWILGTPILHSRPENHPKYNWFSILLNLQSKNFRNFQIFCFETQQTFLRKLSKLLVSLTFETGLLRLCQIKVTFYEILKFRESIRIH